MTGERAPRLPETVVEDLLASSRRRHLLACLDEHGGRMVVADLARAVAAREAGVEPAAVDREQCRRVREDIYGRHLPKLTATRVVDFDSMRGAVTLRAGEIAAAAGR
jgi:hypothetical protein